MEKETKLRVLCLLKILYEHSDEDHPLSTSELIGLLQKEYDLYVHRTTIASDVEQLKQFGIDIQTVRSSQNKYCICDRWFSVPELKLLIDAVESSKFITEKKSNDLVVKLTALAGKNKSEELRRTLYTEGRIKPGNEKIYYIIDVLHHAINKRQKVAFRYFRYNKKKSRSFATTENRISSTLTHSFGTVIIIILSAIQKNTNN